MHPNHVIIILKVLMEQNVPFILCRSASLSALAPIPEDLQSLLKGTQAGLIVDFMPQADVLRHPNVGVFLTHGGINSTFECVVCGGGNVMPVFWPMAIDQPLNALTMTQGVSPFAIESAVMIADFNHRKTVLSNSYRFAIIPTYRHE